MKNVELQSKYLRAQTALRECLLLDENRFLQDELRFSIDKIVVDNDSVIFRFTGNDSGHFIVETRLRLLSPDKIECGYYTYQEDENEEVIDDFLVFT